MHKISPNEFANENWVFQFFISSKYRILRHVLLIVLIGVVLYNSTPEITEPTLVLLLFFLLFYSNMYVLVPRLLFKNKYAWYFLTILSILGLIIIFTKLFLAYFGDADMNDDGLNIPLFSVLILVLIAASTSIKLFQKWVVDKQLIFELEKSRTSAELEQLKNQINPHFLFNMLNNANVLTQKDPEKASQVLLRLSDLLRYQLYDSARDKVLLTSDIHFLEDFLNLERIRRDNFNFLISKEGNLSGVQIPPLLFISFVENAVKHNNDSVKPSYVNIFFEIRDGELIFQCINSKPVLKAVSYSGGLGLVNIKRRLELLFPLTYSLKIVNDEQTFTVYLTIKL
ncbi:sensor histidine kinase [Chryseobacterium sp. JV274]|uniref:sensor histidine kinase n=1 Tax=Chryseobacterium sp. JV274 TaxID=1932669 RepID=UPI0015C29B2B|nr:histidine kinase [Chryseobacterium sp. JV274]CAD0218265.1 Histidine kinase [Chryseobacterium sp. JV274]